MKSNLLKVFCGMFFAMFMQISVEGMQTQISDPSNQITNCVSIINEAINNKKLLFVKEFLSSLFDPAYSGSRLIDISENDVKSIKETLCKFAESHSSVAESYPNIFGEGPDSLINLLRNKYDPNRDSGVLIIENNDDEKIHKEYMDMIDSGIEWDFNITERPNHKFSIRKKRH